MGLKRQLRPVVDRLAQVTGRLAAAERAMSGGVTILTYHRVPDFVRGAECPLPTIAMPVAAFAEQMKWLVDHTRPMTLRDALSALDENVPGDRPVTCVTFDDGYQDNAAVAAPVLAEYAVPATFFVTTGLIGTDRSLWHDRAASAYRGLSAKRTLLVVGEILGASIEPTPSLSEWMGWLKMLPTPDRERLLDALATEDEVARPHEACRLMDWEQVRALASVGHEIGSHTLSHPILTELADDDRTRQIADSKAMLERELGVPVEGLCYPNGSHDEATRRATESAGYRYACTTQPGRNEPGGDRFALHRVDIAPSWVLTGAGAPDELGFRAEISLLRERFR